MYWIDFLAVLVRRWYAVLVGLLLTALALAMVTVLVGPTYAVSSTAIVLPAEAPAGIVVNRYANLPLTAIASLVTQSLTSDEAQAQLRGRGLRGQATATTTTDGTPVVVLSVQESNAATAQEHLKALEELGRTQLRAWQNPLPPQEQLTLTDLITPSRPHALHGSRLRALAAVVVLGLALTSAAVVALDRALTRRRRAGAPAAPLPQPAAVTTRSG